MRADHKTWANCLITLLCVTLRYSSYEWACLVHQLLAYRRLGWACPWDLPLKRECVWYCCGSSPLQWLLHAGHLMCSELGYTHTHTRAIGIFRTVPRVWRQRLCELGRYLDPVQLFTQVCSGRVALLNVRACKWKKWKSLSDFYIIGWHFPLVPFHKACFVTWHAFYYPLLYTRLLCGPCNRWALRCQSDSFHAAAVPQRATCVIRVEQRGPVQIDFIEFFSFLTDEQLWLSADAWGQCQTVTWNSWGCWLPHCRFPVRLMTLW